MSDRKIVDIHTHMIGIGDSGKGCRTSKEFVLSAAFSDMLKGIGTPYDGLTDERIREILLDMIDTSEEIDYAVMLSVDGVYKNGRFREPESHLVVPNDYIMEIARMNRRILFGASVHPYREAQEMLAETKRCIGEGAVLFNWTPAGQQIDPEDDRCIPFYVCLARESVPLLCHTAAGFFSDGQNRNKYYGPNQLRRALDIGVKVIISHGAAACDDIVPPLDSGLFHELMEMLRMSEEKKWDLYADISALCRPSRIEYLERIKKEIGRGTISSSRFIYGSGFPIPAIDINKSRAQSDNDGLERYWRKSGNPLDNWFNFLKEYGLPDEIFTNAFDILGPSITCSALKRTASTSA